MTRITRWALALFLVAGGLGAEGAAEPLTAQVAEDCVAVTQEGDLRECTATEKMGQCLFNAVDSFRTCEEWYDDWWITWVCDAYFMWDSFICLIEGGLPGQML
jgi:hypothetical protein